MGFYSILLLRKEESKAISQADVEALAKRKFLAYNSHVLHNIAGGEDRSRRRIYS